MIPLKCEVHCFMSCVVIFYSNENEPVKCVMTGLSTALVVFPCSEEITTGKAHNEGSFDTFASYFIQ